MLWHACVATSDRFGLGHLVRVQALFHAAGIPLGHLWVWTDWSPERLGQLVQDVPFSAVALNIETWPGRSMPDALVVDMPDPPISLLYQTCQIKRKLLLGCSDSRQIWADLTVNVAEGSALDGLEPSPHERLWQGARFAVLRPEFLKGRQRHYDPNGPILVVIGGTDSAHLSLPVARVLLQSSVFAGRAIEVVACSHHPNYSAIEIFSLNNDRLRMHAPTSEIAKLLETASAAVIAPGNLLFECLALRTPALAVVQNHRQLRDFIAYPWLMKAEDLKLLPSKLSRLMCQDLESWLAYADRAHVGQSVTRLIEWLT